MKQKAVLNCPRILNMRSKEIFGPGKTLPDAERSVLVGVQELLPASIRVQFCCFSPAFGLTHE